MREARLKDRDIVVQILCSSFRENKSVNFVVKQDAKKEKRLRLLMLYSFFMGINFGQIFISDDQSACCILIFPDKKRFTFQSMIWDFKLVFGCIGLKNLKNVVRRERLLKSNHPGTPFIHLWYVGVFPEFQSLGRGSRLINEITAYFKDSNKCFYLETSTIQNLSFYDKLGFKITNCMEVGYSLYILKR